MRTQAERVGVHDRWNPERIRHRPVLRHAAYERAARSGEQEAMSMTTAAAKR
jgi:hypothetical protein